jgi:hypothetical protein
MVTADLRAVEVAVEGRRVDARFTYESEITDEQEEIVNEIEGLVIGDLDDDVEVRFNAECVRPPQPVGLVRGTTYCYLRRET